ncbi:MAG: Fe-S cluster assembly protein HesB [Acidobacteria bacterium]|nr:Fe-S cluster assembly protein HesB [Acidobacteriota bacterium]
MSKILWLEMPKNFSFKYTIFSHGWSDLLPFELGRETWHLSYVFIDEESKSLVSATISEADGKLAIEITDAKIGKNFEKKILRDARHLLRLDDDLSEFYQLTKSEIELAWIAVKNAGRLLRSPTVFEDLVKTICTTNCSWALTKKMVTNLVEKLGEKTVDGKSAFPTAEAMANVSTEFYKDEIRAGYRAPYFSELAEKVASGKINPESWLHTDLSTGELKKEMKQIKGVGDYAAENLLKLVGRYDGLALDSWLRAQFYKKHNGGNICADKECDMTSDWL